MRHFCLIPVLVTLLIGPLQARPIRQFEDATIRAVQFVDKYEGWAVGDEGVIWHSIDGGKNWERQPSGTRASLRSLHFITPHFGYAVGRQELPMGQGSVGVILFTKDAGENWRQLTNNAIPGLNLVRFVSEKVGYLLGDATDEYPTGIFVTKDSGNRWAPLKGPRCTSWKSAGLIKEEEGTLVGGWTSLGRIKDGKLVKTSLDDLGGRHFRSVYLPESVEPRPTPKREGNGIAVGQGGLVLFSKDNGANWDYLELRIPKSVRLCLDFNTVHGAGKHVWIAGRPGSVMLHSADGGKTWELQKTGVELPIHSLFFLNEKMGWGVGELGAIVRTIDGGKTWTVQRRGGRRVAMMSINADSTHAPLGAIAKTGGHEGYLTTAIRVITPDARTSDPKRIEEEDRLAFAVREVGGTGAESLWQFSIPAELAQANEKDLVKHWTQQHGERGTELLLRNLVLAIRIWRPSVIITDNREQSGTSALIADVLKEAFRQAGDPKSYPEQIQVLGLKPWSPVKLYERTDPKQADVSIGLASSSDQFRTSILDVITAPAELLARHAVELPTQDGYQLVSSTLDKAEEHQFLMQGVKLAFGGEARRKLDLTEALSAAERNVIHAQNAVRALTANAKKGKIADPNRLLGSINRMLKDLPLDAGARAIHGMGWRYVNIGEWNLARETFLLMVQTYPAHPLSANAYRWLIQHNSSSETRRRHELGQFIVTKTLEFQQAGGGDVENPKDGRDQLNQVVANAKTNVTQTKNVTLTSDFKDLIDWHKGSLKLGQRLFAFGNLYARDPKMNFALQAARRHLGEYEPGVKWLQEFAQSQPKGSWRDAALSELWLTRREGKLAKPALTSRETKQRPYLDGKFDDACWKGLKPVVLKNAVGETEKTFATQVRLAYDRDFLYLALRCEHPEGLQVQPVQKRTRDMDLDKFDRVTLELDLDRDYSTAYRFEVDQRGCLRESCWGDANWNPRWFVAVKSEATYWQIEAAIPVGALTGDFLGPRKTWCCNVVRTLPGHGAQAFSRSGDGRSRMPLPVDMGLLQFKEDRKDAPRVANPVRSQMKRVP